MSQRASRVDGVDPWGYNMGSIVTGYETYIKIVRYISQSQTLASPGNINPMPPIPNAIGKHIIKSDSYFAVDRDCIIVEYHLAIDNMDSFYSELYKESFDFYKDQFDTCVEDMLTEDEGE